MRSGGVLSQFSEGSYRGDLGQLSGSLHLYPYLQYIVNTNVKPKIDLDWFSLLVPDPSNFLVVRICILIFHGVYSYLVAKDWENFRFLGNLLYFGDLISIWET